MTRIRDIRLIPLAYHMPPIKAYGMARRLVASRGTTLVEVETADGAVGIGQAWGPAKAAAGYLDLIKGEFVGAEIYDHGHVWSRITSGMYHLGLQNQMTALISGINIALYDAIGKIHGLPVCKLLGGKGKERIPVYASGGYLTHDPDNRLDAQLERVADKGFPGAKFKIGINPKSDEERVKLARAILGDDCLLLVDVNGNYTVDLTLESMRRTAHLRHSLLRGAAAAPGRRGLQGARAPRAAAGCRRRGAVHGVRLRPPDRCPRGRRRAARSHAMWRPRSGQGDRGALPAAQRRPVAARLGAARSALPPRCTSWRRCPTTRTPTMCRTRAWSSTTSARTRCGTICSRIRCTR